MAIETFTKDILPIFENTCMTIKGKYPMFMLVIIGEEHFQCPAVETDQSNQIQRRYQIIRGDLIVQLRTTTADLLPCLSEDFTCWGRSFGVMIETRSSMFFAVQSFRSQSIATATRRDGEHFSRSINFPSLTQISSFG